MIKLDELLRAQLALAWTVPPTRLWPLALMPFLTALKGGHRAAVTACRIFSRSGGGLAGK